MHQIIRHSEQSEESSFLVKLQRILHPNKLWVQNDN